MFMPTAIIKTKRASSLINYSALYLHRSPPDSNQLRPLLSHAQSCLNVVHAAVDTKIPIKPDSRSQRREYAWPIIPLCLLIRLQQTSPYQLFYAASHQSQAVHVDSR